MNFCEYAYVLNLYISELVEALKAGGKPPMRPSLINLECESQIAQLMAKCWAEEPSERPDFPALKTAIRRLTRSDFDWVLLICD